MQRLYSPKCPEDAFSEARAFSEFSEGERFACKKSQRASKNYLYQPINASLLGSRGAARFLYSGLPLFQGLESAPL
jgi:hypothetical protein